MKTKSDLEIRQAVLQEWTWDPRVEELSLGVSVQNGVVTLSGVVRTDPKRLAAEEAAGRVDGVRMVINQIQVGLGSD